MFLISYSIEPKSQSPFGSKQTTSNLYAFISPLCVC
jgi:hypothetical protein